jgi:hypothetical protein
VVSEHRILEIWAAVIRRETFSEAFCREFAPFGTTCIYPRIPDFIPASWTGEKWFVFEKLNHFSTGGTGYFKYILWLPASHILTRAAWLAHLYTPYKKQNF